MIKDSSIAVWFSCGAASAVAAKKTIELYGDSNTVRVINNPVAEEHEDNRRFLLDVQEWIGQEVEIATNDKYPSGSAVEVWEKRKYMSGVAGAPCTVELKKKARQQWEARNPVDWHVLGFVAEELDRHSRFILGERENVIPVLIDHRISKPECAQILSEAGIKLPEIYRHGFPNANCIGCVKATSPTYWNLVRKEFPEVFKDRADQAERIGARLVRHNNERIFLHELPVDAVGAPLKSMSIECGIFCEE